jgi:hypothetical protein
MQVISDDLRYISTCCNLPEPHDPRLVQASLLFIEAGTYLLFIEAEASLPFIEVGASLPFIEAGTMVFPKSRLA